MNFSVIPSDRFKKEAKRLVKKFPSLKQELAELSNTLTNEPETGTPLGKDIYKIIKIMFTIPRAHMVWQHTG